MVVDNPSTHETPAAATGALSSNSGAGRHPGRCCPSEQQEALVLPTADAKAIILAVPSGQMPSLLRRAFFVTSKGPSVKWEPVKRFLP